MHQDTSISPKTQAFCFIPTHTQDEDALRSALFAGLADCVTAFEPGRKYTFNALDLWTRLFQAEGVSPSQTKAAFELWLMTGHHFPFPADVLNLVKSNQQNVNSLTNIHNLLIYTHT